MYHYGPPSLLITLIYMALGHVIWTRHNMAVYITAFTLALRTMPALFSLGQHGYDC